MSDIIKFFQRGSKKSDLSNKSETEQYPKKIRKGSLDNSQTSEASNIRDDIFTESLNSLDCVVILFNCQKNIKCKMREMLFSSKK